MRYSEECMTKRLLGITAAAGALCAIVVFGVSANAPSPTVNFARDVAPILYNRCIECRRPGEIAPMSVVTYQDARPWAESIQQRVHERSMPPWSADPSHAGNIANDPSLSQKEIDTITAWVNGGCPKGDD